jgi:cation:H+ antiporter
LAYLLLLIGIPALIAGAELLVRGASSLALRLGVSELVVGLTVVAFGTSAPELMVSMLSAFQGVTDIAVGNVVGSNISNILLILGISGLVSPLALEKSIRWREIPFCLLATLVLAVLANDAYFEGGGNGAVLTRGDGLVLLAFFAVFLYYQAGVAIKSDASCTECDEPRSVALSLAMSAAGVAGLALGGQWLVSGATAVAGLWGVSDALIGLTVVAVGTSLPELATSLVAAMKRKADMAVGNIVGSNVFNVLWILGSTAAIKPIQYNTSLNADVWILVGATLLFFVFTFTGKRHKIDRSEAALFLVLYVAYLGYIVARG